MSTAAASASAPTEAEAETSGSPSTGTDVAAVLETLPPVEFCCAYGSALLPLSADDPPSTSASRMIDFILGVADPVRWHALNMELNPHHYSKLMSAGGPSVVTGIADFVGVGVHFNPFVPWRGGMIKYGVARMHDLAMDLLSWDKLYLSGRLQKPVRIIVDDWDLRKVNLVNLKLATSASLLLLPETFTEWEFYAKICSLSYMGDLRMLFAEDKNKVTKIVRGSFPGFQAMYKPHLQEHSAQGLLEETFSNDAEMSPTGFWQDCSPAATDFLFSGLPLAIQRQADRKISRAAAAKCVLKMLRWRVMTSSMKQAVAGLVATGGVNAARYLGSKMTKAWRSRISLPS